MKHTNFVKTCSKSISNGDWLQKYEKKETFNGRIKKSPAICILTQLMLDFIKINFKSQRVF